MIKKNFVRTGFCLVMATALILTSGSIATARQTNHFVSSLSTSSEFSELVSEDKVKLLLQTTSSVLDTYVGVGEYNMTGYNQIGNYEYRQDCSGFVDACLAEAGIIPYGANYSSHHYLTNKKLRKTLKSNGFKFKKFNVKTLSDVSILVRQGSVCLCFKDGNKFSVANWGSMNVKGFSTYTKKQLKKRGYTKMYTLAGETVSEDSVLTGGVENEGIS